MHYNYNKATHKISYQIKLKIDFDYIYYFNKLEQILINNAIEERKIQKILYQSKLENIINYYFGGLREILTKNNINNKQIVFDENNFVTITLFELDKKDSRIMDSNYMEKYSWYFYDYSNSNSFVEIYNSPNKYELINSIFHSIDLKAYKMVGLLKNQNDIKYSKSEFEFMFDNMLEEFILFTNNFEFNVNEAQIINEIKSNEKINSNIVFAGLIDKWV